MSGLLLIVLIPVAIVLAVVLSEVLLLLLLLPVVLGVRIVFRRPWVVDVRRANNRRTSVYSERVVGWRDAGERVQQLADFLCQTGALPPGSVAAD